MHDAGQPTAELVFQDFEAIIVTSEWDGSAKVVAVHLDQVEADAGSRMSREQALDFVCLHSDHYLELARAIDSASPASPPFLVEIEPDAGDGELLNSAHRRLRERLAAQNSPNAVVARIHDELSELHARRMRERR